MDILNYLIEKGAKNYLKCLLEECRPRFFKYFIEIGADIDVRNDEDQTPLICVAMYRRC
jgi:ankyrin repeat protein